MTDKQRDYILGLDEDINNYLYDGEKPHYSYDILGEGWEDVYKQIGYDWASDCITKLKKVADTIDKSLDWADIPFGVDYEGDAIF